MSRAGLLLAVLVLAGCTSDGVEEVAGAASSTAAPTTPASTQPPATSAEADAPRVFSMRPVLAVFSVSPAVADPDGDHPASVDAETGITIVDDVTTEAYLYEAATGLIYWVGPAFLTGADIESAEALLVSGPNGAVASWVVVPEFTAEGRQKFRTATAALAQEPTESPTRQLAIVIDGAVILAPAVADGVGPKGLDPDTVVISVHDTDNAQQEAEDLAATLRR